MANNENKIRFIDIDASDWKTSRDLYDSILPALKAPEWHGDSANALVESMVWGEINGIDPPYTLRIHSTGRLPTDVAEEVGWIKEGVENARADFNIRKGRDVDVAVEILK